jgi:hypothetical protein
MAALSLGSAAVVVAQTPEPPPDFAPPPDTKVFDPDRSAPLPDTQPEEEPSDDPIGDEDVRMTEDDQLSDETVEQPGWGNARDQSMTAKRAEEQQSCTGAAPPTSHMLGFPGAVAASESNPFGRLLLIVAVGALVVAGIAYALRRGKQTERGPLETVATVVGILGSIAGLAVLFVPGVGVEKPPPPDVSMEISDINRRITQNEYAKKTQSKPLRGPDGREVGNVIWLRIHLEGYGDKPLTLQYASFDPDTSGALLPGTAVTAKIPHEDVDVETQFVPVWVGYPKSKRFEAAFRLLHERRVQAIAETGQMKGSRYRYSC